MTEIERLTKHLRNLKKSKVRTATFDVAYLLGVMEGIPSVTVQQTFTAPEQPKTQKVNVDGGAFKE
jgi:hypothetical protein